MVKKARGETVHYVFQGLESIYIKNVTTGKVKSYVYALGKVIARVDGVIGDTQAKKYWYHTDHVGSVKAVTNQAGNVVWNADYLPFGKQYMKNKPDAEFEEDDLGFTGKGFDNDTGLYYFNARWYDADIGRFISEDPIADPNNPNLYTYGRNNPLSFTDPTGLYSNPGHVSSVTAPGYGYENSGGGGSGDSGGPGPGGGGSNTTNKYRKDGTLKSSRTTDNNVQTTTYYDKEGNVTRVSVIDYNTGMQTITSYREGIPRSVITFNSRGDIVDYRREMSDTSYNQQVAYRNSNNNEDSSSLNNAESDNKENSSSDTTTAIKDAINELEKTDWGKKHPEIINKLWDLYDKGKIKVSGILAEIKKAAGYYSPYTKNIVINKRYLNDPKELAALLVHEGTHAFDHSTGNFWRGSKIKLSTEYRAKLNEEAVEINLGMRESFSTKSEMYDYLVFNYCTGVSGFVYYNDMKWLKAK